MKPLQSSLRPTMESNTRVPPELLDAILGQLDSPNDDRDGFSALCSCSLASRSLHSVSVRYIFSDVRISQDQDQDHYEISTRLPRSDIHKRCRDLFEIITKDPLVASAIRSFELVSRTRHSLGHLIDPFWARKESVLPFILPQLCNVVHLEMREKEMLVLWPSIPRDIRHAIERFLATTPSVRSVSFQNLIHFPASNIFACPSLRQLSLSQVGFASTACKTLPDPNPCEPTSSSPSIARPMIETLRLSESGMTLQNLSSPSCPLLSNLKTFTFTIFSMTAFEALPCFFSRVSHTLEHLHLRFIGQMQYFSQTDMPDLTALASLRSLTLSINCIHATKPLPSIVTSLLRLRSSQSQPQSKSASLEKIELRIYWMHVFAGMEREIFRPNAPAWEELDDIFTLRTADGYAYEALKRLSLSLSFGFVGSKPLQNEKAVEGLRPAFDGHFAMLRKRGVGVEFVGSPWGGIWYEDEE